MNDNVSKTELVRLALAEVGEASHQELADFIERRHGVRIDPKFLPVVRASVRELEQLERARQAARAAVEQLKAKQAAGEEKGSVAHGQAGPTA